MKKLILSGVAVTALAFAGPAAAGDLVVAVTDPTDSVFKGSYTYTDENGDEQTGTQKGYVGVYDDGIVACNGNEGITRPDTGGPLQGYIWIGSDQGATSVTASDPSGNVGAGNRREDGPGGEATGNSPCPDAEPSGVNEVG